MHAVRIFRQTARNMVNKILGKGKGNRAWYRNGEQEMWGEKRVSLVTRIISIAVKARNMRKLPFSHSTSLLWQKKNLVLIKGHFSHISYLLFILPQTGLTIPCPTCNVTIFAPSTCWICSHSSSSAFLFAQTELHLLPPPPVCGFGWTHSS